MARRTDAGSQVHPEGKYVVDIDSGIDINKCTPGVRVALRNDSYALHLLLPTKVRLGLPALHSSHVRSALLTNVLLSCSVRSVTSPIAYQRIIHAQPHPHTDARRQKGMYHSVGATNLQIGLLHTSIIIGNLPECKHACFMRHALVAHVSTELDRQLPCPRHQG